MRSRAWKLILLPASAILLARTVAVSMTVDVPAAGQELVQVGEEWRFFRGKTPPSDPADAWKDLDFDDTVPGWETGPSGFGYGDDDDETELTDMQGSYLTVYIRKQFTISSPVTEMRMPCGPGTRPTAGAVSSALISRTIFVLTPAIRMSCVVSSTDKVVAS